MPRVLAVDWSGDRRKARSKIWIAEAAEGRLVRLESGRTREEVADWLVGQARTSSDIVVGLDFAFSFPAWFVREHGSAHAFWAHAKKHGERWLQRCEPPFWGRPGRTRTTVSASLRRTDLEVPDVAGIRPKSPFQIGGAGAVGTGSVRGMGILHRLSEAGFSVWPFDEPRFPLLIEIYPRLLTGPVRKSDRDARCTYLGQHCPQIPPDLREKAESSEDAFDAAVSALVMDAHRDEITRLMAAEDDEERKLEGEIWRPRRESVADSMGDTNCRDPLTSTRHRDEPGRSPRAEPVPQRTTGIRRLLPD